MAEDVIIRYRAEVDELTQKVNAVISQQEKLAVTQNKTQKELNQTTASVKKLETELSNTGQSFKKAEAGAKGFGQTVSKEIKPLGGVASNIGLQIAGAFAAAFSVQQVIAFGKASIDAFLEAEKSAHKLHFAITQINGETEQAFQRLIKQSNQLQKTTKFSDESIQAAQTALATFGLTSDQIEKLIPQLADFAEVTGRNIKEAATIAGQGLVGMGRELNRLGIEVSASNTRMENLSIVTQGLTKFNGAAEESVKTLTGQIENQANQVDELQEQVGAQLAPAWVKVKRAIFEATLALLSYSKVNQTTKADIQQGAEDAAKLVVAEAQARSKSNQEILSSLTALIDLNQKERDDLELSLKLRVRHQTITRADQIATEKQLALKQGLIDGYKAEAAAILANIDLKNRELSVDKIKLLTTEELNKALIKNKEGNDIVSKDNVDLIENEIKAREKLAEKAKQLAEETAKKQREENEKTAEAAKKAREKEIGAGVGGVLDFKSIGDEKVKETKRAADEEVKIARDTAKKVGEIGANAVEEEKQRREELKEAIVDFTEQTVSAIAGFYSDFLEGRITDIDNQLNTELASISSQEEALKSSLDKRIISQSEFTKQQEILQNKRLEAEKKADKETRKLKRQQLIIDKTTALIEIGLDLQKAIAAYSANPITATLLPVIAGVITAALAAVSAVSIPAFKKGTKAKKGSGMALVGEEGPELTYLPTGAKVVPARQTKAYSELIDAMYDNNVDKYILKQYVAPRLEAQRRQYQDAKDQTFVKNIVNNMSYNGLSLSDQLYANSRGVAIKDKKELAEMVGKAVAENIPRPDPWRM